MLSPDTLTRAEARVPRYTSYPTAPHFTPTVGQASVRRWLSQIDGTRPVSVYVHVPFCAKLCWYCGCNTSIASRYEPVRHYLEALLDEIGQTRRIVGRHLRAGHLHFGGGTPNALGADDFARLADRLHETFVIDADSHFEIELDPRTLDAAMAKALVASGVTRVNLGIQDFAPAVQAAINRIQPVELVAEKLDLLRAAGLDAFGCDLLYGLPHQTPETIAQTVAAVAALGATRVALFGYAHVPWMKPHQKLLEPHGLPGTHERLMLAAVAHAELARHGYGRVGIDHFAKPDDALAVAAREGLLRRNFQGYTTDTADTLLAFGPSAISAHPQGYAQNHTRLDTWRTAVEAGDLPVARGCTLTDDDRLRRNAIERLMCDMTLDLDHLAHAHRLGQHALDYFAAAIAQIDKFAAEGLCERRGAVVTIPPAAQNFVRIVASAFDVYFAHSDAKHSVAV
jgi:oxygen-independent coproporphyrinogen-3 oxidase